MLVFENPYPDAAPQEFKALEHTPLPRTGTAKRDFTALCAGLLFLVATGCWQIDDFSFPCESSADCLSGYTCDGEVKICLAESIFGDGDANNDSQGDGDSSNGDLGDGDIGDADGSTDGDSGQIIDREFDWVTISSGAYMQGSPLHEEDRFENEGPQREVSITRAFQLKATLVTQKEWQDVMGSTPSLFENCGPDCPVERISWWSTLAFLNKLSTDEGLTPCYELNRCSGTHGDSYLCESVTFAGLACQGYRLPTEAEWEFAARAGTTGPRYGALEEIAWYGENSNPGGGITSPQPVGQKAPNAWGLYDMIGNVGEWTWDRYGPYTAGNVVNPLGPNTGTERVIRSCSWSSISGSAERCRAAFRDDGNPNQSFGDVGFRPARTLP